VTLTLDWAPFEIRPVEFAGAPLLAFLWLAYFDGVFEVLPIATGKLAIPLVVRPVVVLES